MSLPWPSGPLAQVTRRDAERTREFVLGYSGADALWLLRLLVGIDVAIVSGYIMAHIVIGPGPGWWEGIRALLDVDNEATIPAWFSSIQLCAVACLLFVQAARGTELRPLLFVAGFVFLFLSMDEGAAFHDGIYRAGRHLPELAGRQYLAWMVPYACLGVAGVWALRRHLLLAWRRFHREAILVGGGGALYVTGGIFLEIISARMYYEFAVDDARLFLTIAAEELFEMVGVTIMLYGFMLLGIEIQSRAVGLNGLRRDEPRRQSLRAVASRVGVGSTRGTLDPPA